MEPAPAMGEKPPKEKKRSRVKRTELTAELATESTYDVTDAIESTTPEHSSLTNSLMQSHAELCAALRLAGRQILRLRGDQESLNKIRQALNKAEALRKIWKNPELAEAVNPAATAKSSTEPFATPSGEAQNPERKRPGRLSRPHAHRVLRFPSGEG